MRLKDATVSSILKKVAAEGKQAAWAELLEIIQVANADKLTGVVTDELVAFLRRVLYDENRIKRNDLIGAYPRTGRRRLAALPHALEGR
jgi:hypothetical protein